MFCMREKYLGWEDRPAGQSSCLPRTEFNPETYIKMEKENQSHNVLLQGPHAWTHFHTHTCTHTLIIKYFLKFNFFAVFQISCFYFTNQR